MFRHRVKPRGFIAAAVVVVFAACSDPITPPSLRPRGPHSDLFPPGRVPTGQPLDSTPPPALPAHPASISLSGLPGSDTVAVGTSVALTVQASDATGTPVLGATPVWRVSDTTVATIDSVAGVLNAVTPGALKVGVTVVDTTAWFDVVVAAAAAPPTPPPTPTPAPTPTPVPSGSISLTVVRFDGPNGAATVSNGIPLAPGALRPGQESDVHIYVGGVEQAVYVAGLSSLHPDGSLRAVLVQFQVQSLSTPQQAMLSLGGARSDAMTLSAPLFTPGTSVPSAPNGLPQAAALPDDPNYLIATDLVGGTISSAATAALGGVFARYESDFVKFGGTLWRSEGANWGGDYYDRALIYYAMWVRTGDPTYWERAGQIAYDYRAKYLEANNFVSSPHWAQLEGLEKHYLMTGDDKSRFAVGRVANVMNGYIPSNYMSRAGGDSRIAARVLHAQLLAWRLTPPGQTLAGISAATFGTRLEAALGKIVAWQQPDGSYPADGVVCGGQLNYMVGLLNDALIKTYDYYVPAATSPSALQGQIQTLVQKAADYMWTTQWLAANRAFQYTSVTCAGVGGPSAAPDLNNLISTGFGWLYRRTGDAQYLTNGDAIFAGGVTQAWLNGSKQFNENYTASFRYLGYR